MIEANCQIQEMARAVAQLATALALAAAPAAAEPIAGEVTASLGAGLEGPIAEGEHVRSGEDGACSILLDDDAVVELCGDTSVVFRRDPDTNRRIVSIDAGEIRIVVEPRDFEERIEIHTPAAIATLLGTIVHVAVDSSSGATTITSAESKVSVRSDDADVRGTTLIQAGERVTLRPGEAPPATPERLEPREIAELGGCRVDFHVAAADRDSRERSGRVADALAAADAQNPPPAPGDRPRSSPPAGNPGDDPLAGQEGVCVATDCDPLAHPPGIDSGDSQPPRGLQTLPPVN